MTNTPKTKECFECGYILDIDTNVCPGCKTDLTFSITKEYESINIEEVIKELNNAYYRFEAYTWGKLKKYKYFGFNDAFTKLFAEMQKPENFTPENCELMGNYYLLTSQLVYYIDQGMIENENIHSNKGFVKDLEEMLFIQDYRLHEFLNFVDESKAETRFSITDILNAEPPQPKAGKYISDSIYKNQPQPKADDSLPENKFTDEDRIKDAFAFTLEIDPRKHKQILSDDDFDKLINWVSYFFDNNFQLPDIKRPIKKVNTAKGNIIYTFKKLFKELHPEKSYPDGLFQLIQKCFFPYYGDKIQNMKKTKEPTYYQNLIDNK